MTKGNKINEKSSPKQSSDLTHIPYHSTVSTILNIFQSDPEAGLSIDQVTERLEKYGKNQLPEPEKTSIVKLFFKQFANFMIYILLSAVVLALLLQDYKDAVLIGIVVLVTACIGFFQEYKAEKTLESLKKMATPTTKVVRDGQIEEIATELLVPGDIVILEEGDIIPADLRLLETVGLEINEAILTGESVPSKKDAEILIEKKAAVGDRLNMAFMGTVISVGNGRGVVVATGNTTQIGKIAETLAIPLEKPTPLQKNLNTLGKYLVIAAGIVSVAIFVIGYIQGREVEELLFTVISLAVAVIPEGLVAVVAITMAVGVQRMAQRNAIVRHLPAVETLGAVNVICSDKTGTLTEGKMVATDLWVGSKLYTVSGSGIKPEGKIYCNGQPVTHVHNDLKHLLTTAALCNDAVLQQDDSGTWESIGDPTEVALQVLAHKLQFKKEELEETWKFEEGLPFDSNRRRMSLIYSKDNEYIIFTKGAPETMLEICSHVLEDGKQIPVTKKDKELFHQTHLDMASRGLRVLALAMKPTKAAIKDIEPETTEKEMIFLGLVGILDPPRPEVKQAVLECKQAGIQVMMITGDHPATANNIATQLGIFDPLHDTVMSGEELDTFTVDDLAKIKPFPKVFARVSPENKLLLVNTLRKMKYVVAMTGDGVNDAPAIKHANVGIAMGKEGTDVTKQAADIILVDDNFATIVSAVEEGRRIFNNIQKFVRYLLSCNVSNVFSILFATAAGIPLPFTPIQILWLNLVTDTPPALALGFDEAEQDAMKNPPRNTRKGVFRRDDIMFILYNGIVMAGLMLAIFFIEIYIDNSSIDKARTMAFAMLVLVQLTQAFNAKSTTNTLFRSDIFKNTGLIVAVALSFGMLIIGMYMPFLRGVFEQVELSWHDWIELGLGVIVFVILTELFKLLQRFTLRS
jgi:P-type Ca2+ transporter type 2C